MIRRPWAILAALLVGCSQPAVIADPIEEAEPLQPAPVTRAGGDWPTFLGPTQDNVSTEKGIIAPWPKAGLGKVWDCPLGAGYAPPVVAGGKLFHFDRFGDNCRLTCRDAATGKLHWQFDYPTDYRDFYGY